MVGSPVVVTALALLLGSVEPPPAPVPPGAPRDEPVPILMYHVVGNPPPSAPWPHLFVDPEELEAQLAWLEEHGFEAVTLTHVLWHWRDAVPLPRRPVVITFDDGYHGVEARALPLLARRGWPAVLNLKVGNVGEPGGLRERQVRRLLAAGWELAAHTITHPDLTTLSDAELDAEVAGSRRELRRLFGVPVDVFCYPSGRYDARVLDAVRRAGYVGATTTLEGLATPERPFELKRIRVGRGDGVSGLRARIGAWRDSAPAVPASGSHG